MNIYVAFQRSTIFLLFSFFTFTFSGLQAQGTWEYVHNGSSCSAHGTSGSCMQGRHEASYVECGDRFILLGGRENNSNVNIYDPIKKIWTVGANAPISIHHFQAVEYNGLILIAGAMTGNFPNETPIDRIIIYDPQTDKWLDGPSIPSDRRRGSAGVIIVNDKLYIVSGIQNGHKSGWVPWMDEYDLKKNVWRVLPDAPHSRDHFHAALVGNKIVAGAGRRSGADGTFNATVGAIDIFDLSTEKWTTGNNIPTERAAPCVAVLGDEVLYMGGEKNSGKANNETEAFNIKTGKWRSLAKMKTGRHGTQAIVNNQNVYVASGSPNRGGGRVTSQERFYLNSQSTPSLSSVSRSDLSAVKELEVLNETKKLTISNTNGNQAILIEKISRSGSSNFSYSLSQDLPFLLKSGSSFDIEVSHAGSGSNTGSVKIEHTGSNGDQVVQLKATQVQLPPQQPSSCDGKITGFELNLQDGSPLISLAEGVAFCEADLSSHQLRIRAPYSGAHESMSISIERSGNSTLTNLENHIPYDSYAFAADPGTYTITAKLYNGANLSGDLCDTKVLSFIIESNSCNPPPIEIDNSSESSDCTIALSDDFAGGFGNWNDGGGDSNDSTWPEDDSNACVLLRDNSGTASSTFTNNQDYSDVNSLNVSFDYYPSSMEANEDFFFEYSLDGGSSWAIVQNWVRGTDFDNNTAYSEQLEIEGPFTSETRLRFRCDASGNLDFLYLDNVVVESCGSGSTEAPTNIAPLGVASQVSTSHSGLASRAIDRNTNGSWSGRSVTHTTGGTNRWWQVELDALYSISEIKVYNRTDNCCKTRLRDFSIIVYDENGNESYMHSETDTPDPLVALNGIDARGKTVRIQFEHDDPLSLAEVEVYGVKISNFNDSDLEHSFVQEDEDESNGNYATESSIPLRESSKDANSEFDSNDDDLSESKISNLVNQIKVFPNPATNSVNIDLSNYDGVGVEILFYDLMGQEQLSKKFDKNHNPTENVDISNLLFGQYVIVSKASGVTLIATRLMVGNR